MELSCKVIEIGGVRQTEQPRISAWSRGRCGKLEDEDKDETSQPYACFRWATISKKIRKHQSPKETPEPKREWKKIKKKIEKV
ncbi:BnaA08g20350D [Brassica napus]|uniref:(rape) hypothetical protein n=1 Tax=Brassica napus TaxID=3708 RepID=A0A078HXF4_BRANA|nr:unnamed protein product [Brassica napus]CAF1919322.1 unnamed protein product [Brassica napus]CAF2255315.1 unnamed protein product [Brassica napus]CDY14022.1 BnaC02g01390D [Brassica napus]CDY41433.1 BnaA08g20350D [Brassica napus]